ncbi:MAG: single-stranded DNA-binding protein [Bacteroidetes bacterium]|nr:single-stranded DNA-binding protein [Bacteroidota bacterium]
MVLLFLLNSCDGDNDIITYARINVVHASPDAPGVDLLADIAERFLVKGKEAAIEGKLVNRSYQDREGNKRYFTEIQVNELLLLGSKVAD